MIFQLFEAYILNLSCYKYIFNIQSSWKCNSQCEMCFKNMYQEHDKKILPHVAIHFSPYIGNYICAFGIEWFLLRSLVNVTVLHTGVSPCLLVAKLRASCRHQLFNTNLYFSASLSSSHFSEQRNRLYFYGFSPHVLVFKYKLGRVHKNILLILKTAECFLYVYLTHCLFGLLINLHVKIKY